MIRRQMEMWVVMLTASLTLGFAGCGNPEAGRETIPGPLAELPREVEPEKPRDKEEKPGGNHPDPIPETFEWPPSHLSSQPYLAESIPYQWLGDAAASTAVVLSAPGDDEEIYTVALPFAVRIYGVNFDRINIYTNGMVNFGAPITDVGGKRLSRADSAFVINVHAIDLAVEEERAIVLSSVGEAPHRRTTILWQNVGQNQSKKTRTGQLVFTEGVRGFVVQYAAVNPGDAHGLALGDGTTATSWSPTDESAFWVVQDHRAVAGDEKFTLKEDGSHVALLPVTDEDPLDRLTLQVVAPPAHGAVSFASTATSFTATYTPAAHYFGADEFSYRIFDGTVWSRVATVAYKIQSVNDIPTLTSAAITGGNHDGIAATVVPSGWADADGDLPGYQVRWTVNGAEVPVYGLTLPGSYVKKGYTLRAFVRPFDGIVAGAEVATATVFVTNAPPVAADATFFALEDVGGTFNFPIFESDVNDTLTVEVIGPPTAGVLTYASAATFTYVPSVANAFGDDAFSFRVHDGTVWSNTATVTLSVQPVNDAPTLAGATLNGGPFSAGVTAYVTPAGFADVDGDPAGYLYRWEVNGVTVPASGAVLPASYVSGGRTLQAFVSPFDGTAAGAEMASLTATVANTAASASNGSFATDEDAPLTAALPVNEPDDDDTLQFDITASPTQGGLAISGRNFTYTQSVANWSGADQFTFRVNDGSGWSNVGTVNITVNSVNDAPVITLVSGSPMPITPGVDATFTVSAADVENDAISLSWMVAGVTQATGASFTMAAPAGLHQSIAVVVKASDGNSFSLLPLPIQSAGPEITGINVVATAPDVWEMEAVVETYGEAVTVSSWLVGGTARINALSSSAIWNAPGTPGIYTFAAVVTDADGYAAYLTMAAAITAPTQWAGWGNDRQSTGIKFFAESLSAGTFAAPAATTGYVVWSSFVGGTSNGALSLGANGTVFGSQHSGGFYALRTDTGELRWTRSCGCYTRKISSTIGGTVYLDMPVGELDGLVQWSAGGISTGQVAIADDGTLYTPANGLAARHPISGQSLWTYNNGGGYAGGAVVAADGTIYFANGSGVLHAINPEGTNRWTFTFPQAGIQPALAADGTIYIGSYNDYYYAINPDGTQKWSVYVGQDSQAAKLGADGTIYLQTTNGGFNAISPAGQVKWTYNQLGTATPAIAADGTIYMTTYEYIRAFNPDKTIRWSYHKAGVSFAPPTVDAEGAVYTATSDGYAYKFK